MQISIAACAFLPSRFGLFKVVAFTNSRDGKEHLAIVRGEVAGKNNVLVRIHSECMTGDALGSLRCDCRDQLEGALGTIGESPCGVLLYMRQEGRGIGLTNKIRSYELQDAGHDTVEANILLGFQDDERTYDVAAEMLRILQVQSVCLLTNNPRKLDALKEEGIEVVRRVPLIIPPNQYNAHYLQVKRAKSGHLLEEVLQVLERANNEYLN